MASSVSSKDFEVDDLDILSTTSFVDFEIGVLNILNVLLIVDFDLLTFCVTVFHFFFLLFDADVFISNLSII